MRIVPNNWAELQHYKDRSPPWIKLHKKLLDNFEFQSLPVASRALAPMLWLLASDHERGEIDAAPKKLAFRLRMTEREVTEALKPLIDNAFFASLDADSNVLADRKPEARPETEAEKRREEAERRASEFETFWAAYPKKEAKKDAEAAWAKVDAPLDVILAAVKAKARTEDWTKAKGQFVPLPATYLRGKRWEDQGVTVPDSAPKGRDPALLKLEEDAKKAAKPAPEVAARLASLTAQLKAGPVAAHQKGAH